MPVQNGYFIELETLLARIKHHEAVGLECVS